MNLLDVVHHKEFLDRIFPDGISEKIVVAQVLIDSFGSTELGIHVRKNLLLISLSGGSGVRTTILL